MTVLQKLAPGDLRRIVSTYRDVLRTHQEELNALNVYPVPDGDTGTNMALTLESVVGELDAAEDPGGTPAMDPEPMDQVCEAIRHGSLMGARGNSGVILSQILRGLADTFSPLEAISGADVAAGLRRATDAAYQAVLRPVEGTILTVVRAAAESVERAVTDGETTLAAILERAADAARDAVASTPDLLPVLREAGVVDAGGRGFELLLAACLNVVDERPVPPPEEVHSNVRVETHSDAADGRADGRAAAAAWPTSATRSCTSSTRPTTASTRSSRRGARSATRSSWWVATASGTATCTPTTSAPRSRPGSRSAVPATSGSPTCSSRSPAGRRKPGSEARSPRSSAWPPAWSRSRWARACARCCSGSGSSRWWRAGSR